MLLPSVKLKGSHTCVLVDVAAKAAFWAMFNDGVAASGQEELHFMGVVNSDLVWLEMEHAIGSLIHKTCSADTTHIDTGVAYVFDVKALDAKRNHYLWVLYVFYDHVLFAFIVARFDHHSHVSLDFFYL